MAVIAGDRTSDSRQLLLQSLDGTAAQRFDSPLAFLLPGVTGHRMPPRKLVTQTVPGMDGSWLRQVQVGEREVFLPVVVFSDSHDAQVQAMQNLQDLLDPWPAPDYTANDGALQMVAMSTVGGQRILPVTYSSGLEGDEGVTASGAIWNTFGIRLLAVSPYWQASADNVLQRTIGAGTVFLANSGSFGWPRSLSAGQILGQALTITVQGEVPCWPTIEVVGPVAATTYSTSSGMSVTLPNGVAGGKGLRIVTDPRRRSARLYDVDGSDNWTNPAQAWGSIGVGPTFAPLQPGDQTVTMAAPNATSATRLRLRYRNMYRSAW